MNVNPFLTLLSIVACFSNLGHFFLSTVFQLLLRDTLCVNRFFYFFIPAIVDKFFTYKGLWITILCTIGDVVNKSLDTLSLFSFPVTIKKLLLCVYFHNNYLIHNCEYIVDSFFNTFR